MRVAGIRYTVDHVTNAEFKGYETRYTNVFGTEQTRSLNNRHGIRLLFRQVGEIGQVPTPHTRRQCASLCRYGVSYMEGWFVCAQFDIQTLLINMVQRNKQPHSPQQ